MHVGQEAAEAERGHVDACSPRNTRERGKVTIRGRGQGVGRF